MEVGDVLDDDVLVGGLELGRSERERIFARVRGAATTGMVSSPRLVRSVLEGPGA